MSWRTAGDWAAGSVYICAAASGELWTHPGHPPTHCSLLYPLTDIEVTALCPLLPQLLHPQPPVLPPPPGLSGRTEVLWWGTAPVSSSRPRRSLPLDHEGADSFAFFPGHLRSYSGSSILLTPQSFLLAFYFPQSLNTRSLKSKQHSNKKFKTAALASPAAALDI